MKKLLLLLCVFLSTAVRAQEFYEPSDLDVMWRVWDDERSEERRVGKEC